MGGLPLQSERISELISVDRAERTSTEHQERSDCTPDGRTYQSQSRSLWRAVAALLVLYFFSNTRRDDGVSNTETVSDEAALCGYSL